MIERYALPEMANLFADAARMQRWVEIELLATEAQERIGVVPVGYGHGYSWLLSGKGRMLVNGRSVPILGRVTMDLTMVDVTDVPEVRVGDEVVLFGEQRDAVLPVEEVATGSETLPYEILCTIGKRVTRLYVRQGQPVRVSTLIGERAEWSAQVTEHLRQRDRMGGA